MISLNQKASSSMGPKFWKALVAALIIVLYEQAEPFYLTTTIGAN